MAANLDETAAVLEGLHIDHVPDCEELSSAKTGSKQQGDNRVSEIVTSKAAGEIAAIADARRDLRNKHRNLPQLISLSEYVVRPRVSWLVRDLLPAGSLAVVFGAPKSGKTQVVMDLMMHAAHGQQWHGYEITRPLSVAYLAGEGHNGLRVRLRAWQCHYRTEMRGDFRLMAEALPLATRIDDILTVLRAYRPDVVVTDTVNAFFGSADENSSQDMTSFMAAVRSIRDQLDCGVILVHHTGHAEQGRERGSSVMRGAVDVVIQVARDERGSGEIGVQVITARDMEPWDSPLSLRLQPAPTDWVDDEGKPIGSVIVVAGNAPVTLPGRRSGRTLGKAQAAVLDIALQLARQRANGAAEVTITRREITAIAEKTRSISRQSVSSAWRPLAERGLLRLIDADSVMISL